MNHTFMPFSESGGGRKVEKFILRQPHELPSTGNNATLPVGKTTIRPPHGIVWRQNAEGQSGTAESSALRFNVHKTWRIAGAQPIRSPKALIINKYRGRDIRAPKTSVSPYSMARFSAPEARPIRPPMRESGTFWIQENDRVQVPNFQRALTKSMPFVIFITTKLQKKRNMFDEENDKSTRLPAAARQI